MQYDAKRALPRHATLNYGKEDAMKKRELFLLTALIAVCFCVRSPLSPVGPLVDQIRDTLQLSAGAAGLITTIPLLLFGLTALFAGDLQARIPARILIPSCLLLSCIGLLLRSYAGVIGLFAGTALVGMSVGVIGVSLPVLVRTGFPSHIGLVTSLYTMSMALLSALASGLAVPFSNALGGWQNGLAVFALLPVLAAVLWRMATKKQPVGVTAGQRGSLRKIVSVRRNRALALFMALQSSLFYCALAWLPSLLIDHGFDARTAGLMAFLMQLVSLATNFLMPLLLQRFPSKRRLSALLCPLCYLAGLLLLLPAEPSVLRNVSGAVLLGLGSGCCFSFAMAMIALGSRDDAETAGLSAFTQSAGYLLSAPAPALLGLLLDVAEGFALPVCALLLLCLPLGVCGVLAAAPQAPSSLPMGAKE